jgi:hypothetical protein
MIPVEVTQTPWHYTSFWDWLDRSATTLPVKPAPYDRDIR